MKLDSYSPENFSRGKSPSVEACWLAVQALLFSTWLPGAGWRRGLLRLFGAEIGKGVIIKPDVRIKFPWRLRVGDHSWIGEAVWIDNLDNVTIGSHSVISQQAYLCTGSHDWNCEGFDLNTKPIIIGNHAWVCAGAIVAPGVNIGDGAVLCTGSVATRNLTSWHIHQGNPAIARKKRPQPGQPASPDKTSGQTSRPHTRGSGSNRPKSDTCRND